MKRRTLLASALLAPLAHADDRDWDELVRTSLAHAQDCARKLESQFGLSRYKRWTFSPDGPALLLARNGPAELAAKFQVAGSIEQGSGTWVWSWADPSIFAAFNDHVEQVRNYGQSRGFARLTEGRWLATEAEGYEMAAIANYLLQGNGVHAPPHPEGQAYFVLRDVRKLARS